MNISPVQFVVDVPEEGRWYRFTSPEGDPIVLRTAIYAVISVKVVRINGVPCTEVGLMEGVGTPIASIVHHFVKEDFETAMGHVENIQSIITEAMRKASGEPMGNVLPMMRPVSSDDGIDWNDEDDDGDDDAG